MIDVTKLLRFLGSVAAACALSSAASHAQADEASGPTLGASLGAGYSTLNTGDYVAAEGLTADVSVRGGYLLQNGFLLALAANGVFMPGAEYAADDSESVAVSLLSLIAEARYTTRCGNFLGAGVGVSHLFFEAWAERNEQRDSRLSWWGGSYSLHVGHRFDLGSQMSLTLGLQGRILGRPLQPEVDAWRAYSGSLVMGLERLYTQARP